MKNVLRAAFEDFGLAVFRKILIYGSLAVVIICALLLFELEEKYKIKAAKPIGVVVSLAGLFFSFVTVPQVFDRMKADKAMSIREVDPVHWTADRGK